MRILIVEDDSIISEQIKIALVSWGYEAFVTKNFSDPLAEFISVDPHLVLMDVTLPINNGFYRCSKIREVSKVPVIFISSASDNLNMITALNMGGDDFIAKPFDMNVLLVKIRAILRRTYEFSDTGDDSASRIMECRGMTYNPSDSSILINGNKIDLTKNENRIMNCLLASRGVIVSRSKLMEELWNDDCFVDENTLSVNINRLRRKLEDNGLIDLIVTKKGQGYIVD